MTHKHIKFKRAQDQKFHRNKTFDVDDESHEERSRRVLLLSSEDVDRMAIESSRARLMMQLVSKPEETCREFGSYFRGQKNVPNPVYIMTSHTSAVPIRKRIVPAYPSLIQSLKWSPSVRDYSEDSQTDTGENDSNCRCHKCKTKHWQQAGSRRKHVHRPRDNIMKFSDNSTMTPKVTEIGCGVCSSLNQMPITSKVSMATSEIVVKDPSLVLPQNCRMVPIPILKKCDYKRNVCQNIENNMKPRVTAHEAVRDTNYDADSDKIFKPLHKEDSALPLCPNNSENSSDCEYIRKVIYNEGISDLIKKNIHCRHSVTKLPPMRVQSPINMKRNFSKVPITNKCFDKETVIPYAHRVRSKYHSDCKQSFTKSYRCEIEENNIHSIESPLVFRRVQVSKAIRCTRIPSIRLPKKVLTSEKNIEAFVDKRKSKK